MRDVTGTLAIPLNRAPFGRSPRVLGAVAIVLAVAILVAWLAIAQMRNYPASDPTAAPPIAQLPAQATDAPVLAGTPTTAPADARARNAATPFAKEPLVAASSFRFRGSDADRARASECLALAALAEAGDDDQGQRAVMQVVLNRVRHPAFARTVCGVVFQGSERTIGCQFSFTCDGSLARRYGEAAWSAARLRAGEALGGRVYRPVGIATHYHTDWVHPWWSPKLLKVAQVDTHLFFRWPGYWGSRAAASLAYRGGEPGVAALTSGAEAAQPIAINPQAAAAAKLLPKNSGAQVVMRDPSGRANFVTVDPGKGAASALATARSLCTGEGTCRVYGWSDGVAVPKALPLPPSARAQLQFSYARDPAGAEIVLYGCDRFAGVAREQCIPRAR